MNLIEAWKKEKGKPFKERLNEEIKSYGQAIVNQYFNNISKLYLISIGKYPASAEEYFEMMMSSSNTIFYMLKEMLPETEDLKKDKERTKRVVDFLLSEKMAEIPSIRLTTQLWSVLADQFSNGGRKIIPGGGIANDVSMVSTILPYCNAMFIDRENAWPAEASRISEGFKKEI